MMTDLPFGSLSAQGEVVCIACAMKSGPNNIPMRISCVVCGNMTWSNSGSAQGQSIKCTNGETLVRLWLMCLLQCA